MKGIDLHMDFCPRGWKGSLIMAKDWEIHQINVNLNFLTWLFLVFAFRFCRLRKGMGYEEVNI
jgi:hypothetical protein